jgi:L-rhamnose mutarotase
MHIVTTVTCSVRHRNILPNMYTTHHLSSTAQFANCWFNTDSTFIKVFVCLTCSLKTATSSCANSTHVIRWWRHYRITLGTKKTQPQQQISQNLTYVTCYVWLSLQHMLLRSQLISGSTSLQIIPHLINDGSFVIQSPATRHKKCMLCDVTQLTCYNMKQNGF